MSPTNRRSSLSPTRRNARLSPSAFNNGIPTNGNNHTTNLSPILGMSTCLPYQLPDTETSPSSRKYTNDDTLLQPSTATTTAPNPTLTPFQQYLVNLPAPDIQIESVASWATIGFFLSLYLKYMHSLIPLVHKPTFAKLLAMRADKGDPDFRAFLLGLGAFQCENASPPHCSPRFLCVMPVAYTIGQSPITRMEHFMSRPDLISLQHDCHRASMILLNGKYKGPSLIRIGSLMT
jgi:hypothetical protein